MTKPTPSPCETCPVKATCHSADVCDRWIKWLFSAESEEKYRQVKLR